MENENKSFEVFTPIVKSWAETIKTDSGEKTHRFFEVAVSGLKEDRDGEVMDQMAIDDMLVQFKSGKIPFFPDHGKDSVTGERTYSWKQIMGVWVDGRQDGDKLMAVARLNSAHPDADMFWNFLQEGIPVGFSIGGTPKSVVEEVIHDTQPEVNKEVENGQEKA